MKVDTTQLDPKQPKPGNLVMTVMLVAGVPLLFIGFVILQQFGDAYRTKTIEHLTVLVKKHSRTIDSFLTDRMGDIRVLARSHPIEQLADPAFLTKNLAILREEYGGVFVDIGLIDPDGVQHAYSGPYKLSKADYAGSSWFKETQQSQYFISDVFSGLRGSPHFIVAVKIPWNDQGWILRATVDFNAFNALVSNVRIGTTGHAFILNQAGEFQTKTPFESDRHVGFYKNFIDSNLEAGTVLVTEQPDALGRKSVFAVTPLNNGRWILCYQQEIRDAFATWNRTRNIAFLMFVLWAAIVAVFTYFMSSRMTVIIKEVMIQKDKMSDQVVEAGRLASIGELAAGIAHEINNPVAIMVEEAGWIQDLLAEEDPTKPDNLFEIERATAQIKTQGARCKEITHKLLFFARKTDPTVKPLDLNEMVREMITLVDQKTRYANVRIETQLEPDLPSFLASASELQQVLLNLLNNGVDAMSSSGGIIHITTQQADGRIVLTVADNGMGIAEANLSRIFDPFYTTKPVGQGTGLGLSICYGIIEKLGGNIQAKSSKGEGTTFTITLPAEKIKPGASAATQDATPTHDPMNAKKA